MLAAAKESTNNNLKIIKLKDLYHVNAKEN